jgi:hypothetical protein
VITNVNVPNGQGIQLLAQLPQGSTVVNADANNGVVWIAPNPIQFAGQGVPLYPGGSIVWSGGPVYGYGVTSDASNQVAVALGDSANQYQSQVPARVPMDQWHGLFVPAISAPLFLTELGKNSYGPCVASVTIAASGFASGQTLSVVASYLNIPGFTTPLMPLNSALVNGTVNTQVSLARSPYVVEVSALSSGGSSLQVDVSIVPFG